MSTDIACDNHRKNTANKKGVVSHSTICVSKPKG